MRPCHYIRLLSYVVYDYVNLYVSLFTLYLFMTCVTVSGPPLDYKQVTYYQITYYAIRHSNVTLCPLTRAGSLSYSNCSRISRLCKINCIFYRNMNLEHSCKPVRHATRGILRNLLVIGLAFLGVFTAFQV